jgi:hypothetical protein
VLPTVAQLPVKPSNDDDPIAHWIHNDEKHRYFQGEQDHMTAACGKKLTSNIAPETGEGRRSPSKPCPDCLNNLHGFK